METNNRSITGEITDEKSVAQSSYLKPLIVHASECYKLMTNPRSKNDELSETTKYWLKERAVEEVLGLRKMVATKPMMKGAMCVHESIDLYNKVMLSSYKKNSVTKEEYGFCGTPNLLGNECVIKITTSWDATTFPFFRDDVNKLMKKSGYDWQCRAYMMLFGKNRAVVSYCLVDTPNDTPNETRNETPNDAPNETTNGDALLNKGDDFTALARLHRVVLSIISPSSRKMVSSGSLRTRSVAEVDAQKRVSISEVIERDSTIEQKMHERYVVANRYYQNYLEELYNK